MAIKVCNTNSNRYQRSAVRMYNSDGVKIVELFIKQRDPLGYLNTVSRSKYFEQLHQDLQMALEDGLVTLQEIEEMLATQNFNYDFDFGFKNAS